MLFRSGGYGEGPLQFDEPSGVAAAGRLLVVAERARVQIVSAEGEAVQRLQPHPAPLAISLCGVSVGAAQGLVRDAGSGDHAGGHACGHACTRAARPCMREISGVCVHV